jgi:hypothetical protein
MLNFSFIASLATASSYTLHHHDGNFAQPKLTHSAQPSLSVQNAPLKNPQPSDK